MVVLIKTTYCDTHTTINTEKARGPVVEPRWSRSVLFNLFVIVEHLIHFRVCHGTRINKILKT